MASQPEIHFIGVSEKVGSLFGDPYHEDCWVSPKSGFRSVYDSPSEYKDGTSRNVHMDPFLRDYESTSEDPPPCNSGIIGI